ncbi:MAG TPA: hypothetical protein VFU19_08485 [Iamia sp.]|nr:hypothetical protein [Iamia sp.]
MPARKRRKTTPAATPAAAAPVTVDRQAAQRSAAEIFAERQQAAKATEREAARVRREAQAREDRRRELTRAKDRAADRLKEVRRRGASGEARAEAEAAYRAALDALIRDEQGLPPLTEEEAEVATAAPQEIEGAEEAVEDR